MAGYEHDGWKTKYKITKLSGKPLDPKAEYFVLRLDKDPHARKAALAYAKSVRQDNQRFAGDITSIISRLQSKPLVTIEEPVERRFAYYCEKFSGLVNLTAHEKGFWRDGIVTTEVQQLVVSEKIALIHSELSEALETLRHEPKADEHCPQHTNTSVELADAVIRIMDLAKEMSLDLGNAIVAKAEYNKNRKYKHGKEF